MKVILNVSRPLAPPLDWIPCERIRLAEAPDGSFELQIHSRDGSMGHATRLQLLEDALRDRDWMRVMDVVEDMGGNPEVRVRDAHEPAGGGARQTSPSPERTGESAPEEHEPSGAGAATEERA